MNLLINCSSIKVGGSLQVAHSFLYELRNYNKHQYIVTLSSAMEEIINCADFADNFVFIHYSIPLSWSGKNSFLDKIVKKYKIERVFTVFGPAYWKSKAPHICGFARSHYVYRKSPFFTQLSIKEKIKWKIKETVHIHSFRQAQILITENKDVSARLQKMIPNRKIYTVTNYYNQIFDNENLWDNSIQLPEFDGITLLTVAVNYPHKNLQIIPKVISFLINNYPKLKFRFVVSLTEEQFGQKLDENIKNHIYFVGKISIEQCPHLYKQTDFMFLPTLLESFSASYAEAMFMQKPILTSDLGFARGLCGNATIYFNPLSEKDIAMKIIELSENNDMQKNLIEEGKKQLLTFDNYKERAKKYLEIIENEVNC